MSRHFTPITLMMPRDSGMVYSGTVQGSASGYSTMTIAIDGEDFTGPVVRTGSSNSFGFIQQGGSKTVTTAGIVVGAGDTATVKTIFFSPADPGLYCGFSSDFSAS